MKISYTVEIGQTDGQCASQKWLEAKNQLIAVTTAIKTKWETLREKSLKDCGQCAKMAALEGRYADGAPWYVGVGSSGYTPKTYITGNKLQDFDIALLMRDGTGMTLRTSLGETMAEIAMLQALERELPALYEKALAQ